MTTSIFIPAAPFHPLKASPIRRPKRFIYGRADRGRTRLY